MLVEIIMMRMKKRRMMEKVIDGAIMVKGMRVLCPGCCG